MEKTVPFQKATGGNYLYVCDIGFPSWTLSSGTILAAWKHR